MSPKGKGIKEDDAPKIFAAPPKRKVGRPRKSPIAAEPSTPKKKTGSSDSPNKRKSPKESAAEPSRVPENQTNPFHDLLYPSPSHNEYLEHAMFLKKPKLEEEEEYPPIDLPPFEEPPRGGLLQDIVDSAKFLNRRKD